MNHAEIRDAQKLCKELASRSKSVADRACLGSIASVLARCARALPLVPEGSLTEPLAQPKASLPRKRGE